MPRLAMLDRRQFLRARPPSATAPASATPRATGSGAPRPVGDLSPFVPSAADPWDAAKARHLLRRVSMAALPADVTALVTVAPGEAVRRLVAAAQRQPTLSEPDWIGIRQPPSSAPQAERNAYNQANLTAFREMARGVQNRLLGGTGARADRLGMALRERMALVWANHYVTEYRGYRVATWLFGYQRVLHEHALGRVADLVDAVGTTPAMLRYLNGDQNRVGSPNENYARELLELFTMGTEGPDGAATYTQRDVSELSRALTGWRTDVRAAEPVSFDPDRFDAGEKTIFGQTGAFGYDDVTPLLFAERAPQIAHFVADVLYRAFVSDEPDAGVVSAVADRLVADDFEVAPAVEALLASAHFYDSRHVGALVKAPVDLVVGAAQAFGAEAFDLDQANYARNQMARIGQELFNPPDVAGWPGGTSWIDTSSWPERVKRGEALVQRAWQTIADDVAARPSAYSARDLAAELASELLPRPPSAEELDGFVEVLLSGTPDYAWDPTTNGGRTRVRDYVKHLVSLPEFQLR